MTYTPLQRVTWDPKKNVANRQKHGLSLEDAATLFTSGVDFIEIFDHAHSDAEDRFLAIGPTKEGILVVAWVEQPEDTVRIISARRATRAERRLYTTFLELNG